MTTLKRLLFIKLWNMEVCTYYFIEHITAMSSICTAGMGSHEEEGWKYDGIILCFTQTQDHVFTIKHSHEIFCDFLIYIQL